MDLIKKGNNALRDKKYEKAVSIYEKAIVENPNLKKIVSYNLNYAKNKCSLKNSFSNDFHSFLDFKINQKPSRLFKEFNNSEESKLIDIIECDSHFNNAISNVKVSVIMPTFNRIKTIKKAIDSVLNQSHSRLELLVIDDGSTDGTYEFIKKKYKDSRVLLIKGDHKGVSSARNLGIKKSTGEYIFYLDSDNYWRSDFLKLMIAGFLSSGAKVGYSAIKVEDESGKLLGYRGESFNWNECCKSNYVDLNPFGHSRDMIDQFGSFDEKLRRMVDWDMILRFTKNNQPFYIPYIGTIYTETSDDFNRISVKEPYAYKKIVQAKNNFSSNYVEKVKLNFAIKIPAPYEKRLQWGDFHFAESLKNSLEKLGHNVVLDYFGKWYERPTNSEDVVIVIRGLTEYEPRPGNINIMWNISHPDQVSYSEYDKYDIVYVASDSYSEFLNLFLTKKTIPLLQCSDRTRFFYDENLKAHNTPFLFVGNSRNEYREVVKNSIYNNIEIDVFGNGWSNYIDSKYIKSENVSNTDLRKYYGSYLFTLNDHWASMKKYGFISNRVFDVVASGGCLISDNVPSISNYFDEYVITTDKPGSFIPSTTVAPWIKKVASNYVHSYHSFDARAKKIRDDIFSFLNLIPSNEEFHLPSICGSYAKRKTIGLYLQNGPEKPTSSSYIRLFSPLTSECLKSKFKIKLLSSIDEDISSCDAVIIQRVAVESICQAKKLFSITSLNNIPVFVDTDDAFSKLPDTHPEKEYYSKRDDVLRYIMEKSKRVIFSTENLSNEYSLSDNKKVVIENCLDERFWIDYRKKNECRSVEENFKLLYMGTATHDSDFLEISEALDELYKNGYNFTLYIIGAVSESFSYPWIEFIKIPSDSYRYPNFSYWLSRIDGFDLGIAPLAMNEFNQMKSDIKVLDYAAIGIPTICSKVGAYENIISMGLCFSSENNIEDWKSKIKEIFENPIILKEKSEKVNQYLWTKRNAEKAANQWDSILNDI